MYRHKILFYLPSVFCASIVFYFVFHMINGERGLLAYIRASKECAIVNIELSEVRLINQRLENKIKLLSGEVIDIDMLEEQACKLLGVAKNEDEVIIIE